eukprot:sb/3465572/
MQRQWDTLYYTVPSLSTLYILSPGPPTRPILIFTITCPDISPYSHDGINPIAEIACFCFCLVCGAVGTIGNAVAFQFFLSRKKDIANVIYIFIALFDLIISILILPASAIFTNNSRGGSLLDNPTFCNIWGLLWYTSTLMSVFMVAVLSITRSICITFPFAKMYLKKWVLVWVVLFYWVAVTVQGCIPFYMENLEGNDEYSYIPTYGFCTFFTNTFLNGTKGSIYRNIFNFEQYSLIIPILGSSLVTLVILHLPSRRLSRDSMTVTVTILIFTALYIILNIPPCLNQALISMYNDGWITLSRSTMLFIRDNPYYMTSVAIFTVVLNSSLNPLVYLWRTTAFRRHVIGLISCGASSGNGSTALKTMNNATTVRPSPCPSPTDSGSHY